MLLDLEMCRLRIGVLMDAIGLVVPLECWQLLAFLGDPTICMSSMHKVCATDIKLY